MIIIKALKSVIYQKLYILDKVTNNIYKDKIYVRLKQGTIFLYQNQKIYSIFIFI